LEQVQAAGLNPTDSKLRSGALQQLYPLTLPVILGKRTPQYSTHLDRVPSSSKRRAPTADKPVDVPLLSLNDNPGNMVGPEAEKTALVRHCCRTYLIGANLTIPTFFVMTRKSYGLGKLAMTGGSMRVGVFSIAWPTGEFGGMGLEGQVKLGRRRELAAIADPAERLAAYEGMVAELYERGKALNAGSLFEVDEVIDPADTRRWIVAGLRSMPPVPVREGKKRPCVDGW
jgi:acetyl-CoA carboxylase carboxyltransferase component